MVTVDPFNGPIQDLPIAEWLSGCEDAFENYEEDNNKTMTDKRKIHVAGNSISKASPTNKLHSWWIENRKKLEAKKWDEFRDAVKEKALGSGWRIRALKNLYTASQGARTLEDYFSALDSMRFVISRSSKLPEIEDFEFKCHLLFHAMPSLTAQALKNDIRDLSFIDASVDEIKDHLRKYESEDAATSDAPATTNVSEMAAAGMWVLGEAWGWDLGTAFHDMTSAGFPASSDELKHLTRITVWTNNDNNVPLIQGYETQFSGGPTIRNPASITHGNVAQALDFGTGEYITQVKLSRRSDLTGISSIEIMTSKGRSLFAGGSSTDRKTFRAPNGWRIVGFYGKANYYTYVGSAYRYPTPKLGAIYGPVV